MTGTRTAAGTGTIHHIFGRPWPELPEPWRLVLPPPGSVCRICTQPFETTDRGLWDRHPAAGGRPLHRECALLESLSVVPGPWHGAREEGLDLWRRLVDEWSPDDPLIHGVWLRRRGQPAGPASVGGRPLSVEELRPLWTPTREMYEVGRTATHTVDVLPLNYTAAIVLTPHQDPLTFDDRWCYPTLTTAVAAARTWLAAGAVGEPTGWHRHPFSGRRRPDGDPTGEVVAP